LHRWPVLIGILAGGGLAYLPYLNAFSAQDGNGMYMTGPQGWWFPLVGARLISGAGLDYLFGEEWMRGCGRSVEFLLQCARAISLLSYPLMWIGLVAAAAAAWKLMKQQRQPTVLDHIKAIAFTAIVVQCVLDGAMHIYKHPHYYGGTWIVFPLLAWIGFDLITRHLKSLRFVLIPHVAALAGITIFLAWFTHHNRGWRTLNFGSCLGEEIRVVREINSRGVHGPFLMVSPEGKSQADDPYNFGDDVALATVHTNVNSFLRYPFSLNVIQELIDPGPAVAPTGKWLAIGAQENDSTSVQLTVINLGRPLGTRPAK